MVRMSKVVVHVTQRCNMGCTYCYEKFSYSDVWKSKSASESDITKQVCDRLIELLTNRNGPMPAGDTLNLAFFGGEPTLCPEKIEYLASGITEAIGSRTKLILGLQTNGFNISERMFEIFKKHKIGIAVSIDGPKDIHDAYRKNLNGKGTFDEILPNIRRLQDMHSKGEIPGLICQAVVTSKTLDHYSISDLLNFLESIGFSTVTLAPVRYDSRLSLDIVPNNQMYENLFLEAAEFMLNNLIQRIPILEVTVTAMLMLKIARFSQPSSSPIICPAGESLLSIMPNGDVYPCGASAGIDEFYMGNILDNAFTPDQSVARKFRELGKNSISSCSDCRARLFCTNICSMRYYNPEEIDISAKCRKHQRMSDLIDDFLDKITEDQHKFPQFKENFRNVLQHFRFEY